MRFPLDLIAAVMSLTVIGEFFKQKPVCMTYRPVELALAWGGYFLCVWLLNELVTRRAEWNCRFGHRPAGVEGRKHPIESHAIGVLIAQSISVAMYGAILWSLQWPLVTSHWPQWLGLSRDHTNLRDSTTAMMLLGLTPFLIAMILSWIPRRRLISGIRRRPVPLLKYLDFEARMTWLPLIAWVILSVLSDLGRMLPSAMTAWTDGPGFQEALSLAMLVLLAVIGLPLIMVTMWKCRPLPDGELKDRLLALLNRSGVKVRRVFVWGTRDSGLLNACVLGPWSSFRYVLISPALVDELSLEETEAVLAHELGHARHGHLTLLFIMLLSMTALLEPLTYALPPAWQSSPLIQAAVMLAFIGLYVWGFFGAVMRQCELEADLASAELVGSPVPLITALEKLALISGNSRNVYTWHHGSIANRVASVLRLSVDPAGSQRIHAQVRRVRLFCACLTILALGLEFLVMR